ncbi:MAG: hypothetical protein ACYCZQ_06270 [Burkholderiales bacterium]
MDNKDTSSNASRDADAIAGKPGDVDASRRRFAKAGLAGSGVILSISSRSALGGWGTCTGSEMMSGNMSRQGTPNPCGCSPGYWGNHIPEWSKLITQGLINTAYNPDADFDSVFGLGSPGMFNPDAKLRDVARNSTPLTIALPSACDPSKNNSDFLGSARTATFQAVAALLNASVYGVRYPVPYQSPSAVISAFHSAFTTAYAACNKQAFVDFIAAVDVYTGIWCFGSKE